MLNIDFLNNDYADNRTPAEKAREQIKISILNHELKPGQRLIENKLCDQYSLSRPPLREISYPTAEPSFRRSTAACWTISSI